MLHKTPATPSPTIAALKNVMIAARLMKHLMEAQSHLPRMGVLSAPSGYGKSFGAIQTGNTTRAYYVELKSVWHKKDVMLAILKEMNITPEKTVSRMLEQAAEQLVNSNRPLMIDEFDYAVQKNYVDLIRDLYEASGAPIMLIGEELLPRKLTRFERFHNRVLSWQYAVPCDQEDAQQLARFYGGGLAIDDAWLDKVREATGGVTRRIAVNIENARQVAAARGWKEVTLEKWGKNEIYTGQAPGRRSA